MVVYRACLIKAESILKRKMSIIVNMIDVYVPSVESGDSTFSVDLSGYSEWAKIAPLDLTLKLNSHLYHINWLHLNVFH